MTDIPEKPSHDVHPSVEAGLAGHEFESGSGIFFAAVEMTRMPMTVVDPNLPDQPIVFVNQAFLTMTGYEKSEVVGRNCRFLQGPDTDPAAKARLRAAIDRREDISLELINHRKDGSAFWNALFVSPVYNAAGQLVYFFGSQLDITRRKQAEESLSHAQKMEALGQLTGGIAHDFNNLLQVILGYADSLATNLERPDADRARMGRAVGNIREAAERASTLTAQLLSFARKQRLEGRTLSLNKLVEEMRQLAGRTLGEAITIETDLAPGLWPCRLDPTQAEVALLNILINARDAMPEGGRVTIATRNREPNSPGGSRCVAVEITDTGTGIPSDVLARVMDPFFTTKEEGKARASASRWSTASPSNPAAPRRSSRWSARAPRCACCSRRATRPAPRHNPPQQSRVSHSGAARPSSLWTTGRTSPNSPARSCAITATVRCSPATAARRSKSSTTTRRSTSCSPISSCPAWTASASPARRAAAALRSRCCSPPATPRRRWSEPDCRVRSSRS